MRSTIKKKLDKVFSLYIRTKYAVNGIVECVTCGIKKEIKEIQCGHYIPRQHLSTRWDEENCYPQCIGCNVFRKGNYPAFSLFLVRNFGKERLESLELKRRQVTKLKEADLQEMYEEYADKLVALDIKNA